MSRIVSRRGNVVEVDFGHRGEPMVTTAQLAAHPKISRSERWVELRCKEGMPHRRVSGRRMFSVRAVLRWLETDYGRMVKGA